MKKTILIIAVATLAISSATALTGCHTSALEKASTPATQAVTEVKSAEPSSKQTADSTDKSASQTADAGNEDVQITDTTQTNDTDNSFTYTSQDSETDTVHVNYRSNSPVYRALYDTIDECRSNGATGYTVCMLHGSNSYHLVVSYGTCEADRYYDIYKIESDGVSYRGQIGGAHTTAYIDETTACLDLFYAHMGVYSNGSVWVDGGLRVEYNDQTVLNPGEDYPTIPGETISFTDINDFSLIANF